MYDGGPIGSRLPGEPDTAIIEETPALWPPDRHRAATLCEALLLTAASALLPGLAQLRTGRVRAGLAMLLAAAVTVTTAAVTVTRHPEALPEMTADPGRLMVLMVLATALALGWAALLIHSYAIVRPAELSPQARLLGGTAVALMCLLVAAPPLTVARYGYLQHDPLGGVVPDGTTRAP